jgi:hypothetical protein
MLNRKGAGRPMARSCKSSRLAAHSLVRSREKPDALHSAVPSGRFQSRSWPVTGLNCHILSPSIVSIDPPMFMFMVAVWFRDVRRRPRAQQTGYNYATKPFQSWALGKLSMMAKAQVACSSCMQQWATGGHKTKWWGVSTKDRQARGVEMEIACVS